MYLEYLKRMGNGDGDLVSYILHAKTDLDTLYSVYEGKEEDPFDTIVPNRYNFAFNTDVGVEYYISTTLDGNQNITSENDKRNGMKYFSESFEKLLFQSAYDIYERKNKKHQFFFGINRRDLDRMLEKLKIRIDDIFQYLDGFFGGHGFQKAWFGDEYHYILD